MQPHFNPHRNTPAKPSPPAVSLGGAGDGKPPSLPRTKLQDLGKTSPRVSVMGASNGYSPGSGVTASSLQRPWGAHGSVCLPRVKVGRGKMENELFFFFLMSFLRISEQRH